MKLVILLITLSNVIFGKVKADNAECFCEEKEYLTSENPKGKLVCTEVCNDTNVECYSNGPLPNNSTYSGVDCHYYGIVKKGFRFSSLTSLDILIIIVILMLLLSVLLCYRSIKRKQKSEKKYYTDPIFNSTTNYNSNYDALYNNKKDNNESLPEYNSIDVNSIPATSTTPTSPTTATATTTITTTTTTNNNNNINITN